MQIIYERRLICCADKLAMLRGLMSKIMPIAYIDLKRYFGEIGGGYFLRVTLIHILV